MSSIKLLGFPNHTSSGNAEYTTIGAIGLEPADMGVEWLGTEEPGDRARLTNLDPIQTQWGFGTSLVPSKIDGFAVVNHNIANGGQVRFVASSVVGMDGVLVIPNRIAPTSIVASVNRSGAVGNVAEDIETPDGLFIGPTITTSPWSVTLKWPTLTGTMVSSEDLFSLVLRVRRVSVPVGAGTQIFMPKMSAELAAPTFSLGYRAVTNAAVGGQILIFPFNRSDYASDTNFQVKLDFTPASGTTTEYIVLETASLYYETLTPEFDSGWISVGGDARSAPDQPTRSVHYFPAAPWEDVLSYAVLIRTDQARHDAPTTTTGVIPLGLVGSPPTFVQAGVVCAGETLAISRGIRRGGGPLAGPESEGSAGTTLGGQTYGAESFGYRSTDSVELMVTREELVALQDQMGFRRGKSGAFYVALEPGVSFSYQTMTAFWATLASLSKPRPLGRYRADGQMLFSVELAFQEKL